ncbi:hypothetical protein ACSFA8_26160 [Variovorax sp. RT4R15]|uniref:hypothetical protein n=1 Tax=Variovorax sp. RT4R15 TaxID=3443737 RepID=UPI003F459FDF
MAFRFTNWLPATHATVVTALLLALGIGAAFGYGMAPQAKVATLPHSPLNSTPKRSAAAMPLLEALRQSSLLGDADASRELTTLLLDRYDLDGDNDDLFEAVVWIDRDLYAAQNVTLVQRISSHYCDHRVLQWHAICLPAE